MSPEIHWPAIALRLALTLAAGALLGSDRSHNGHPAGLRTVLLVTLAASVAMIQMNLLIPTNGKPSDSYAVMDLMRLPLGILTGVGFIGAGAIVRKDDMVQGVTTAATLWFGTVVGLCLGGGQLILGSVSAVIGYLVLAGLRGLEQRVEVYQPATLTIVADQGAVTPSDLRRRLELARFRIKSMSVGHSLTEGRRRIQCEVRWPAARDGADVPQVIQDLEHFPGLRHVIWRQIRTGPN